MVVKNSNYKLAVFDMDGVLTENVSSWAYVHEKFGVDNSTNFRMYREGKLPYIDFLKSDVSLWIDRNGPISADRIVGFLNQIPIRAGITNTVSKLKELGIESAIISGGIYWLAKKIGELSDFRYIYANRIKTDSRNFIIADGEVMVDPKRKDLTIRELQKNLRVRKSETISVGDTSQDVAMFRNSGLSIAFNPAEPSVGRRATAEFGGNDLSVILDIID